MDKLDIMQYRMNFGKYKNFTLEEIYKKDKNYVEGYLCKFINDKYFPHREKLCKKLNIQYSQKYEFE